MPLTQLATISVPEPRMLSVQVWDKAMVGAVDKAIRNSNFGPLPYRRRSGLVGFRISGTQRACGARKMAKVAHKYAEEARNRGPSCPPRWSRHPEKLLKDKSIGEDDEKRHESEVQKVTVSLSSAEIDSALSTKETEIMQV